jgi:tRNA threonylcarbamoyladenosine biosynthesis protein TsaE
MDGGVLYNFYSMPIISANSLDFISRSAEQTRRLGLRLGAMLLPGDILALSGDLGSGKTTLVQGIAQGWGSIDPVSSPTFVLINRYRRPDGELLHHMDAYRIESALEAEDLDLDALISEGALIVEWAEKIKSALPADALWINMSWLADEQRNLVFTPAGKRNEILLTNFRQQAFGG